MRSANVPTPYVCLRRLIHEQEMLAAKAAEDLASAMARVREVSHTMTMPNMDIHTNTTRPKAVVVAVLAAKAAKDLARMSEVRQRYGHFLM